MQRVFQSRQGLKIETSLIRTFLTSTQKRDIYGTGFVFKAPIEQQQHKNLVSSVDFGFGFGFSFGIKGRFYGRNGGASNSFNRRHRDEEEGGGRDGDERRGSNRSFDKNNKTGNNYRDDNFKSRFATKSDKEDGRRDERKDDRGEEKRPYLKDSRNFDKKKEKKYIPRKTETNTNGYVKPYENDLRKFGDGDYSSKKMEVSKKEVIE
jgi:hypothetical protein